MEFVIQINIEHHTNNAVWNLARSWSISILYFWIKKSWNANSMKKTGSMSKDSSNLSKSRFGYYFHRSLVHFKSLITPFWNIWVIYGSWKSWRSIVFDSEHLKSNSQFAIPNRLIRSLSIRNQPPTQNNYTNYIAITYINYTQL